MKLGPLFALLAMVAVASLATVPASAATGYLKILNPVDGAEVPAGKVVIKWYYEGSRPAFFGIFVDDKTYVADPDARSITVNVGPGKHVVRVIAYDQAAGAIGHPIIAYDVVKFKAVGQGAERPPLFPGVKVLVPF